VGVGGARRFVAERDILIYFFVCTHVFSIMFGFVSVIYKLAYFTWSIYGHVYLVMTGEFVYTYEHILFVEILPRVQALHSWCLNYCRNAISMQVSPIRFSVEF
jgi:hypothetical protein